MVQGPGRTVLPLVEGCQICQQACKGLPGSRLWGLGGAPTARLQMTGLCAQCLHTAEAFMQSCCGDVRGMVQACACRGEAGLKAGVTSSPYQELSSGCWLLAGHAMRQS